MKEKINIAELLKDCPKGMELDCTICNNLKFIRLDISPNFPIVVRNNGYEFSLTKYGQVHNIDDSKCVIFPKGKTTWEGFQRPFVDGDIIFVKSKESGVGLISIYKNESSHLFYDYCSVSLDNGTFYLISTTGFIPKNDISINRLATEEEKQKLFDTIKANGYKWNAETKTLEKMVEPKEEVDDRIVMSGIYFDRENYADEVELHLGNYEIKTRNGKTYATFKNQEVKALKPKFKVGDRIRHRVLNFTHRIMDIKDWYYIINETHLPHGLLPIQVQDHYELVPDKFDITTLKPFDRVLVRLTNNCVWIPKLFYYYDTDSKVKYYPFVTTDNIGYVQCIPYKGNEHLCRTTNDCDNFYKTWE